MNLDTKTKLAIAKAIIEPYMAGAIDIEEYLYGNLQTRLDLLNDNLQDDFRDIDRMELLMMIDIQLTGVIAAVRSLNAKP